MGFWEQGKAGVPGEKPLEARETTNNKLNTHIRRWRRDLNPGHIVGRRVLSPLRHPCPPPPQNWTRKRTGKWCQEFLFLINVSASSFKWSSPITDIEKENRRFTCCDYRKSRTTLRKDYITSDEWSFFEPARLCTPPKPLFSLKPLDATSSMNPFGSRTHHSCHPGVNSDQGKRVKFELARNLT